MEIKKPNKKPEFAIEASGESILEPSNEKKLAGWQKIEGVPEKPPYQIFNWLHKTTHDWINYFEKKTDQLDDFDEFYKIHDDGKLSFLTGDKERITIDEDGNVGVGTSSPAQKLDVAGTIKAQMFDGPVLKTTPHSSNVRLGASALTNFSGVANTAIGRTALNLNDGGSDNTAVGYSANKSNTKANGIVAIGSFALATATTGGVNIAIGTRALRNTNGTLNVAVGYSCLLNHKGGYVNTAIGESALRFNEGGVYNTAVGGKAGQNNKGSSNVFLGHQAGINETGSNKLYISNSGTDTPLIYGDFSKKILNFNGTVKADKFIGLTGIDLLPTGVVLPYAGKTAPEGFLMLDSKTIGSTSSSANYEGDIYKALYEFLWSNIPGLSIGGGRGSSASADWASSKPITLPDCRGRTIIGAGKSPGLTNRDLGRLGGVEEHVLTKSELPSFEVAPGEYGLVRRTLSGEDRTAEGANTSGSGSEPDIISAPSGNLGQNHPHNNMQPWLALTYMIKI